MKKLLKTIYHLIPFKMEFYTLLKSVWKPKEAIYQHLHFVGVFKVFVDKTKSFKIKHYGYQLENDIFWSGLTDGWEKDSTNIWIKLCAISQTIVDIGANTGIYSLIAKTVNPNATVYAFEPVARVFFKLKENILLNNFDIIPVEEATSNADGIATIYDTDAEHTYSVTVNKNTSSADIKVIPTQIKTVTLNTYIKQNAIKKIDLMKIDVETHEPEVLEGFSDYLSLFKPTMLIEILNDEVGERVQNLVQKLDYLYFNINEKGNIKQVDKITTSDFYNYLLCSRDIAIILGIIKENK